MLANSLDLILGRRSQENDDIPREPIVIQKIWVLSLTNPSGSNLNTSVPVWDYTGRLPN